WPDLKNPYNTDRGSCLAGTKMLVVYANGDVGPCCLDNDASIKLGNLFTSSMEDILQTSRYLNFVEGLKREYLNEPLCQHCTYHHRFKRLDNAI
ncbi:MAG: SPASM domain-containing protein, partial [Erysipelotrichaceae bacterium]